MRRGRRSDRTAKLAGSRPRQLGRARPNHIACSCGDSQRRGKSSRAIDRYHYDCAIYPPQWLSALGTLDTRGCSLGSFPPAASAHPPALMEYPYGWPAREACCPHKVQRGEDFAGTWQSRARLSACACALTAK
eukprot:scaffold8679_cov121-Isochrysis_galbana.AAC.9